MFPPLYKKTVKNKILYWQIHVTPKGYYTEYGEYKGKKTTSKLVHSQKKYQNTKKATSISQQAQIDATNKFKGKLKEGYSKSIKAAQKRIIIKAMLARPTSELAKITEPFQCRMFIQPKLNGFRALYLNHNLISRSNTLFKSCPHISFEKNVLVDGELYSHIYKDDFNTLSSIINSQAPTFSSISMEYHVYDYPQESKLTFYDRYLKLKKLVQEEKNPYIKLVPTFQVFSLEEIDQYFKQFLREGFEGAILRLDNQVYEFDIRSSQLIKIKDFIDEEFKIIDYIEGKGGRKGTIGKFVCIIDPKLPYDIKKNINVFKCNVKGNFKFLEEVWHNRKSYLNKWATVKYFQRTPKRGLRGNAPQFGIIIQFRNHEK